MKNKSGGEKVMKKKFCTIMMVAFMMLLLVSVGAISCVRAQAAERVSWQTQVTPTIDGEWTSDDEWTDGEETMIGDVVAFRSTWDMGDEYVMTRWIIEFFTDTTDDIADRVNFCIDGDQSGGATPQPGDFRFYISGHTEFVWYEGDGTDWIEKDLDETEIEWATSLSASPTESTPHWILEFQIPKNGGTVQLDITWNLMVMISDSSSGIVGANAARWPEGSDTDVPDTWGIENFEMGAIPEGLSFGVMLLLSTVAAIVGISYLRKQPKWKRW
jgi:hypothetical protein